MIFVLNEFSQIANIESKLTTYWHKRGNKMSGVSTISREVRDCFHSDFPRMMSLLKGLFVDLGVHSAECVVCGRLSGIFLLRHIGSLLCVLTNPSFHQYFFTYHVFQSSGMSAWLLSDANRSILRDV